MLTGPALTHLVTVVLAGVLCGAPFGHPVEGLYELLIDAIWGAGAWSI